MRIPKISNFRLKELIFYDPETGLFTWLVRRGPSMPGDTAGTVRATDGYLEVMVEYEKHFAHRLAWFYMTGEWPKHYIDHINGNRIDNRFANLRDVTLSVNAENRHRPQSNNRSGWLGVTRAPGGSWVASLKINGKQKNLGSFKTAELAHAKYLEVKRRVHQGCTL